VQAYVGQAVLHAAIAVLVVEVLVRLWRVEAPGQRLWLRALVILLPVLVLPAYFFLAPFRQEPWFEHGWALFASRSWSVVRIGPVGLDQLIVAGLAISGTALFLADLVPLLASVARGRKLRGEAVTTGHPLGGTVFDISRRLGIEAPDIVLLDQSEPVLLTSGVVRPRVLISPAALDELDDEELRAAVGHELVHVAKRDMLVGWLLMAARAAMWFNPVVQLVARSIVQDFERRADDLAAGLTGSRLPLSTAIVKLYRPTRLDRSTGATSVRRFPDEMVSRARGAAVRFRCQRLMEIRSPRPLPLMGVRVLASGLGLAALLFFVV
jgi:Zn-dependent protease with chaperone function